MRKGLVKLTGSLLLSLITAIVLTGLSFAQTDSLEGTYNVTATSVELGTINFLMMLKRSGDKWAGEVKDSPTPLLVSSVTVEEGNKVTIIADASGNTVTIKGKFEAGKIAGDWAAGDFKGQWTALKRDELLQPAEKAEASSTSSSSSSSSAGGAASSTKASSATFAGLEGAYDAKVIADGQGELSFTLIIKREGEKVVASVENPGDLNVVGIELQDPDVVNLSATYQGNGPIPLPGKRTGDELGGKWAFGGFSGSWEAKKKK